MKNQSQQQSLVIVESPSKAKKIQEYLGDAYVVRASYGHIVDLASGNKHGLGVDVENAFRPHYYILDDKMALLQELMDLAASSKEVILSTDNDREGLSIARHLYLRLQEYNKSFKRIVFTEITKKAILKAMETAEDINSIDNLNMFYSQEARRILDRIVGFMSSPFLINHFGPNLSAGRVQSVLTRMIVEREEEIQTFQPEEHWNIYASLKRPNSIVGSSKWSDHAFSVKYEPKVPSKDRAEAIKAELNLPDTRLVVSTVEAKEEKKKAPPPLITAKLQQIMSKEFGMSADRTMKAAQTLYEDGAITYMRTDSVRASDDAIKDARAWLKSAGYTLPKTINQFKNKDAAQDAHECIRPTDMDPGTIIFIAGSDESLVYRVIRNYFLASQLPPAIYNTLKVQFHLKNNSQHTFKVFGKALKSPGFLAMLGTQEGNQELTIPQLLEGQELELWPSPNKAIKLEQKFTQPPARYSEAHLLETLEKKNIGRPSTYAELLNKVTVRNYVEKRETIFYPTELGKTITQELANHFSFMAYDYTAMIEEQLDLIATGTMDRTTMLNNFYQPFKKELAQAYAAHGSSETCPSCQSPMILRTSKAPGQSKFYGCVMFPQCYGTKAA